jgi:NAD dependent epimerase/dehydratase family enzyme
VCRLRTGVVLDASGGALPLMKLPFALGLGVRLGSGRQHMPVIGLTDWLSAVRHAAASPGLHGPLNLTLPATVTNAQFTDTLAGLLHRRWLARTPLRVPAAVLRVALDGFATEVLDDVDVAPAALLDDGFVFGQPSLRETLQVALTGSAAPHQE